MLIHRCNKCDWYLNWEENTLLLLNKQNSGIIITNVSARIKKMDMDIDMYIIRHGPRGSSLKLVPNSTLCQFYPMTFIISQSYVRSILSSKKKKGTNTQKITQWSSFETLSHLDFVIGRGKKIGALSLDLFFILWDNWPSNLTVQANGILTF